MITIKDVSLFLRPSTMDTASYVFVIPGMAAQCTFFQTAIKKNGIFPAGTLVKRDGANLVFGATFRELLSDVRDSMNKFIYKLGSDIQLQLNSTQTVFVVKHVKFNGKKEKRLEWIMPFNSTGIVYTLTHDVDNRVLIIGAFSYLHRLNREMITDAAYYKQQLITAFDTEDSRMLDQTKHDIRRAHWPSCFDGITFVHEEEDEPEPVIPVKTDAPKRPSVSSPTPLETIPEEPPAASTASAVAHLELKICWVCEKQMDICKC